MHFPAFVGCLSADSYCSVSPVTDKMELTCMSPIGSVRAFLGIIVRDGDAKYLLSSAERKSSHRFCCLVWWFAKIEATLPLLRLVKDAE
jgi:hypothetical protein